MKTILKLLVLAAVIFSGWLLLKLSGLDTYLSFEQLQKSKDQLLDLVKANPVPAALVFTLANFAAISLSVPGAVLFTLTAGFLFGPFLGTLLVNISATAGAMVIYFITKALLGKSLQEKYKEKIATFNAAFEKDGASYLLILRLLPIFPFFLINILAGLTTVKPLTFLWTTSLGIVAGSFVYALAGSQLATITSLAGILSPQVLGAFAVLIVFSLIPLIIKKFKKSRVSQATKEQE